MWLDNDVAPPRARPNIAQPTMTVIGTADLNIKVMQEDAAVSDTPQVCRLPMPSPWLCVRCRRIQPTQTVRYYSPRVVDEEGDQVGLCPHCAEIAEARP